MKSKKTITIRNLNFSFDNKTAPFFKDLSISFKTGTLHFIQGKNGVGKSTLLRILKGDFHPQEKVSGSIIYEDKNYKITNNVSSNRYAQHVQQVEQSFDAMIADNFSFKENLQAAAMAPYPSLKGLPKPKMYSTLLASFAIDYDKPVHLLSGGQRQILAIIMALQKPTNLLLLDEPTAALD